jgi:Peptidase family M1 domain
MNGCFLGRACPLTAYRHDEALRVLLPLEHRPLASGLFCRYPDAFIGRCPVGLTLTEQVSSMESLGLLMLPRSGSPPCVGTTYPSLSRSAQTVKEYRRVRIDNALGFKLDSGVTPRWILAFLPSNNIGDGMKRFLVLVCSLFLLGSALGAETVAGPDLQKQVQGVKTPSPGVARSISNWNLVLGKGQLRLTEGQVLPLMDGDREVGVYFKGTGVFTLPIDQEDEIPLVKFNIARNTKVKPRWEGQSMFLDISVREFNLLYEGLQLPSFGPASSQPGESLGEPLSAFRSKYLTPGWRNRSHILLKARHNLPAQAAWYLNFVGDHGLWEFARDPWTTRSEELWFGRRRSTREGGRETNALVMTSISKRILGSQPRRPVNPPLILRNLNLDLTARTDETGTYVATETFIPQSAGMKMIGLNLIDTIFDGSTGAVVQHHLKLLKVTQDGQQLRFDHGEDELLVELSKATKIGSPIQLRFEVEGDFFIHPDGDNRWELGDEPWIPSTQIEGMRFTATAKIRSEKPFFPFASGQILSRKEEGGVHVLETMVDQPTYSFFIVAGKYFIEEQNRDGVTVRVASYAHKSDSDKKLATLALDIIKFYEPILGPFPVKELNVVQRNSWGSGQAPSGFLFITNEAFNPLLGVYNRWFSRGINQRFAHEIAHQYWGNQILIASDEEDWISEAFAQYCSALVIRSGKGESDFKRLMAEWTSEAREQSGQATIPTLRRVRDLDDHMNTDRIRLGLLYGKGAILLQKIHGEIGDQAFATLMKSFQKSLKGRPGTTQDLVILLKLITKKDYTDFFEKYLYGTAMPS